MSEPDYREKDLLIIIPAYNEEKTLGAVLDGLDDPEIRAVADVLVMNDASTDRTEQVALSHGVRCVSHVFNLGYGGGLQVGYKFALRNGYRYVIQMDADGQHDVSNIPPLYRELTRGPEEDRPDIVLGSRYMDGSGEFRAGAMKTAGYAWLRMLVRWMTGVQVADPTTGLQGLSHRTLEFYSRYQHFDDRYPDANMLVQMLLLGFRIRQVPALMHYRTEGKSMHAGLLRPAVYMIRMTLQLLAVWIRIRILKIDVKQAERPLRPAEKENGALVSEL